MALATLTAIRKKVRLLTQSPSVNQLSIADLDEYINTFIAYDFPETLRLFSLKTTLSFYTTPWVDVYETSNIINSPLENYKNEYITVEPPVYIAGRVANYSQSRAEFFSIFPQNVTITRVGTGDGGSTFFTGTLSTIPVERGNVLFSSIASSGAGITMVDVPFDSTTGNLVVPDTPAGAVLDPNNYIDYVTGQFVLTLPVAPGNTAPINAQVYPFTPSRPTSILYYDNKFTVRPIPDMPYKITLDAYIRPTQLISIGDTPNLEQWWAFIAYGAAIKVLQDRMDMESVALLMPEFNKQERLVLRRTIVQQTNQHTATIYDQPARTNNGFNYWSQS